MLGILPLHAVGIFLRLKLRHPTVPACVLSNICMFLFFFGTRKNFPFLQLRFCRLSKLAGFLVMFSLLAGAWQYMFEPREYYILILGIDNAGKTVRSYICNYTQYYTLNTVYSLSTISPTFLSLLSATQRLDLIVHDTLVRVGKLRAFRLVSACSTLAHSTFR